MSFLLQKWSTVKRLYPKLPSRHYTYILLICILSLILSTKGIGDEGNVAAGGDMPRHIMNGVFFHDLARDLPLSSPLQYTIEYFSRYPALSLGHHPLLLPMAELPFYMIFGISVLSARLTIIFFMLIMVLIWFGLVRSLYDENIALLSSLLILTNEFIVIFSREVMTEIPTLAMIILTFYCQRLRQTYGNFLVSILPVLFHHG
jgi:hypothetical protein